MKIVDKIAPILRQTKKVKSSLISYIKRNDAMNQGNYTIADIYATFTSY